MVFFFCHDEEYICMRKLISNMAVKMYLDNKLA